MKKVIIILVVVGGLGGGACYWFWWGKGASASAQVVTAKVERGPVRVTVSSTGKVVSNLDVDIKCKASGEIIKLPCDVSDRVRKDDLLLELDPIDEQRVLKQAEVAASASQAKLRIAQENLALAERTLSTDTKRARAALQSAEVRAKDARSKADRMKQLLEKKLASQEDYDTAETAAIQASSDLDNAHVKMDELTSQELALELTRQQVKLAEAQVENDKVALSIAKDRLDDTKVVAPMDAVVSARNVQLGQIISSAISNVGGGTTVLTLSDLSHIFVLASVDESDIGKVRLDQKVRITADAYPGRTFLGKVVRIASKGVNISNVVTFEVKIEVLGEEAATSRPGHRGGVGGRTRDAASEPAERSESSSRPGTRMFAGTQPQPGEERLMPEMTANVEIVIEEKNDVLTAPVDAVSRKAGKQFATVVKDGGATEERLVRTGASDGVKSEIVEGLNEGETVLVRKGGGESRWSGGQPRPPGGPMMVGGGRRG